MKSERMKISTRRAEHCRRWLGCGLFALCVLGAWPGMSQGADGVYILSSGRKIPLVRSKSFFGVTLRSADEAEACAHRLASMGRGVLEPVPGAPHARVKLLRVAEVTAKRRDLLWQDPSIVEVRSVYTFEGSRDPVISTGTIAVRLRADLSADEREQVWADHLLNVVDTIEGLRGVYCVRPIEDDEEEVAAAERLAEDARVVWAQPNFRRSVTLRQAADEFFSQQWHLQNVGQTGGSVNADINAPEAWLSAMGQDVLIGMFDDGCDVEHEDLAENYIGVGHDPTRDSTDLPAYEDPSPKRLGDRHGTAMMGVACAQGNGVGGRGVAPLARFTASRGRGDELLNDFDTAGVFTFARQQDVDVHMDAWGLSGPNATVIVTAIENAFSLGRDLAPDDPDVDPRGMVIVWAAGNEGGLIAAGSDYSTLPQVIGVGASTHTDQRASYSNYGPGIDMLAPSGVDMAGSVGALVTTDNTDGAVEDGYNVGGSQLDSAGLYTNSFTGTSASCAVAAGVAALILSTNPTLTAISVRSIMVHTCDQISPGEAEYHPITRRSEKYGYGRINAEKAVSAAAETLVTDGSSWPLRPSNVHVDDGKLKWLANPETSEFLVVAGDSEFGFIPMDSACYESDQSGCSGRPLSALPAGVSVLDVITCAGTCKGDVEFDTAFTAAAATTYFGLYARNTIGRYSYGVAVTSDGEVIDSGPLYVEPPGGSGNGGPTGEHLSVSIQALPLEGESPLTVQFSGNAVSDNPVDDSRTSWDFDTSDGVGVDATSRSTTYTYSVAAGETRTFTARLTMYDIAGNVGFNQVNIDVEGPATGGPTGDAGDSDIHITVGVPGTTGSDVDVGVSPFEVELSIDATSLAGTLQSIVWDLADGTSATSIVVPHTFINESVTGATLRLAITATVITMTNDGLLMTTTASRTVTVLPGPPPVDPIAPPDFGPDGSGRPPSLCGSLGLLILSVMTATLSMLRLRRRL